MIHLILYILFDFSIAKKAWECNSLNFFEDYEFYVKKKIKRHVEEVKSLFCLLPVYSYNNFYYYVFFSGFLTGDLKDETNFDIFHNYSTVSAFYDA